MTAFNSDTSQQNLVPNVAGILRGGPLVAGVEVSVVLSESHTLSSDVTKFTMENGTQYSDHIINNPDVLAVTFEMANVGDGAAIARDVFETFKNMQNARTLLQVVTEHWIYDSMAITGITPLHAAPYKGRLQVVLTLQRLRTVTLNGKGRLPSTLKQDGTHKTVSGQLNFGAQMPGLPDSVDTPEITAWLGDPASATTLATTPVGQKILTAQENQTLLKLPLTNDGASTFMLNVGNDVLNISSMYIQGQSSKWLLNIATSELTPLVSGLNIVPGSTNMLKGLGDTLSSYGMFALDNSLKDGAPRVFLYPN